MHTVSVKSGYTNRAKLMERLWVFILSGVIGVIIENAYLFARAGHFENRASVLYGPFNLVYAVGGLSLAILADSLGVTRRRFLIPLAAAVGGIVEYMSSLMLETTYGVISWDYAGSLLPIQGRTSLVYCLMWGVAGMMFIRYVHPLIKRFSTMMDNRMGTIISITLLMLLVFDLCLSNAAMTRFSERHRRIPPDSSFDMYIDTHYGDDYYSRYFKNFIHLD